MILVGEKPYKMFMKWQSKDLCFLQFGDFILLISFNQILQAIFFHYYLMINHLDKKRLMIIIVRLSICKMF